LTTTSPAFPARATRFLVCLPVRCRPAGADGWAYGATINASGSGILFRCGRDQHFSGALELEMLLPDGTGRLFARAVVTRALEAGDGSGDCVIGSRITAFRFRRG
jgi:hypothetical protein